MNEETQKAVLTCMMCDHNDCSWCKYAPGDYERAKAQLERHAATVAEFERKMKRRVS